MKTPTALNVWERHGVVHRRRNRRPSRRQTRDHDCVRGRALDRGHCDDPPSWQPGPVVVNAGAAQSREEARPTEARRWPHSFL